MRERIKKLELQKSLCMVLWRERERERGRRRGERERDEEEEEEVEEEVEQRKRWGARGNIFKED